MNNRYLGTIARDSFTAVVTMKGNRIRITVTSFYPLKFSTKFVLLYLEML